MSSYATRVHTACMEDGAIYVGSCKHCGLW